MFIVISCESKTPKTHIESFPSSMIPPIDVVYAYKMLCVYMVRAFTHFQVLQITFNITSIENGYGRWHCGNAVAFHNIQLALKRQRTTTTTQISNDVLQKMYLRSHLDFWSLRHDVEIHVPVRFHFRFPMIHQVH